MKNLYPRISILLLTFIIVVLQYAYGQTNYTSSNDGMLFAKTDFKGSRKVRSEKKKKKKEVHYFTQISICKFYDKKCVSILEYETEQKKAASEMGFSADNQFFYIKNNGELVVWNVRSGQKIRTVQDVELFSFSSFDDYMLILTKDKLYKADCNTGEDKITYNIPRMQGAVSELKVSENDKYFILGTGDYSYFFKLNNPVSLGKYAANEIKFSADGKRIVTLSNVKGEYAVYETKKPKSRMERFTLSKAGGKTIEKKLEKRNIASAKNNRKAIYETATLSSDGSFIAVEFTSEKEGETQTDVAVYLTTKDSLIYFAENTKLPQNTQQWINKTELMLMNGDDLAEITDVLLGKPIESLDFDFEFNRTEDKLKKAAETLTTSLSKKDIKIKQKVREQRINSPKQKVTVINGGTKWSPTVVVKSTKKGKNKIHFPGFRFMGYSSNGEHLIVEDRKDRTGILKTKDIENADRDGTPLIRAAENQLSLPTAEKVVNNEFEPKDYRYVRFKRALPIDSLKAENEVNLFLKTIKTNEYGTDIQVHLLDTAGTYYYGASAAQWRYIWKKLFVKTNQRTKDVSDFVVTEYTDTKKHKNAIAIVLDHSGSMGDTRCRDLQRAAQLFITTKNEDDAMAIIKYDDRIHTESPLTKDVGTLLKKLKDNGMKGYGGSTSLLDAVNKGIAAIKHAEGYSRKSVIVFTDGSENSSYSGLGTVLKNANMSDVNVHTIAFGHEVSGTYLNALSTYTGGTNYSIFKSDNFDWIFKDVYNKLRYYYEIKLELDTISEITTMLNVHLNPISNDTNCYVFNNFPIDFDEFNGAKEFVSPIKDVSGKEVLYTAESVEKARMDSIARMANKARNEFANLKFPNLEFKNNSTQIVKGTEDGIHEILEFADKYPTFPIRIYGHTDNRGNDKSNIVLSKQRADAIKELLVSKGVDSSNIITEGYGKSHPIADNSTAEGRAKNRRVEFILDMSGYEMADYVAYSGTGKKITVTDNMIAIGPNPSEGDFTVEITEKEDFGYKNLTAFKIVGSTGYEYITKGSFGSSKEAFSLKGYPYGNYNILLQFGKTLITKQIEIVEKLEEEKTTLR